MVTFYVQVPNGEITSKQLRVLGEQLKPFGDELGVGDITSRCTPSSYRLLPGKSQYRDGCFRTIGARGVLQERRCVCVWCVCVCWGGGRHSSTTHGMHLGGMQVQRTKKTRMQCTSISSTF